MRMAKTIDDLETLLSGHGYTCEQMLDVIVAAEVQTKVYKNPAGENSIQILLTFDRPNDCVAVEILRAFDLRDTEYKEATLACLLAATARTPLLRPSFDPTDGEIRLRVDCVCGEEGARDVDVLRAMALLPSFAELWYPQLAAAMKGGTFDANKVGRLNLSRLGDPCRPADAAAPPLPVEPAVEAPTPSAERMDDIGSEIGSVFRAASISQKPGSHPNRLRALFEFRRRLDEPGPNPGDQN